MNQKPFKTTEELLTLLSERGIDLSTAEHKSFAKKSLQHIGYYNLINGYKTLFIEDANNSDTYKTGTTIEEIYALYYFDNKLRDIFLKHILPLETNIKSLIAYYFPSAHPEQNFLTYNNFDTSLRDANKNITLLISEIQRQLSNRVSDPCISHYLNSYGYVPLWVLNNILTFGTVSKFYSLMKQEERQNISKTFHLSDAELSNILTYISSIRNFCAHGNRLYCYRSKRPISNTSIHIDMNLEKLPNGEYKYGKRDLFAAMIAFKLTLSKNEFRTFVKQIDIAIKNLKSKLNVLDVNDVLNEMGFPNNWKELLLKK